MANPYAGAGRAQMMGTILKAIVSGKILGRDWDLEQQALDRQARLDEQNARYLESQMANLAADNARSAAVEAERQRVTSLAEKEREQQDAAMEMFRAEIAEKRANTLADYQKAAQPANTFNARLAPQDKPVAGPTRPESIDQLGFVEKLLATMPRADRVDFIKSPGFQQLVLGIAPASVQGTEAKAQTALEVLETLMPMFGKEGAGMLAFGRDPNAPALTGARTGLVQEQTETEHQMLPIIIEREKSETELNYARADAAAKSADAAIMQSQAAMANARTRAATSGVTKPETQTAFQARITRYRTEIQKLRNGKRTMVGNPYLSVEAKTQFIADMDGEIATWEGLIQQETAARQGGGPAETPTPTTKVVRKPSGNSRKDLAAWGPMAFVRTYREAGATDTDLRSLMARAKVSEGKIKQALGQSR